MKVLISSILILVSLFCNAQADKNTPPPSTPGGAEIEIESENLSHLVAFEASLLYRGIMAVSYSHKFLSKPISAKIGFGRSFTGDIYIRHQSNLISGAIGVERINGQFNKKTSHTQMFILGAGYYFKKQPRLSINTEIRFGTAKLNATNLSYTYEITTNSAVARKKTNQFLLTMNYTFNPTQTEFLDYINLGVGAGYLVDSFNKNYFVIIDNENYIHLEDKQVHSKYLTTVVTLSFGIGIKGQRLINN